MKRSLKATITVGAICIFTTIVARAGDTESGYVDFGKFTPTRNAEYVEVNIKSNLITMVTNLAKKGEPEIAEVLGSIKQVRVNVLGLTEENKSHLRERIEKIRGELDKAGWERVVTSVQRNDDVAVFLKMHNAEAIDGLAVTVVENKQVILVNIVGDIRPEKLSLIGERFNIEPLQKLHFDVKRASK